MLRAVVRHTAGVAERALQNIQRATKAGDDQIVFVVEMVIERALGQIQVLGNLLHRGAEITSLVDQQRRGLQKCFARGAETACLTTGVEQAGARPGRGDWI